MTGKKVLMPEINARVAEILTRIRTNKPLIHHITNFVVMNDTANVTLHVGALPVMAHAAEEVAEITEKASALVLNTGTLTPARVEAMLIAGRRANELGIPIVLDPVGVGATALRTQTDQRLLNELQITIVRGNGGEIGILSGSGGVVKGVESIASKRDPAAVAQSMARERGLIVAITGKRDIISDGERTLAVDNGHAWLTTITGTGCMATTVIAAFAAVERDYLLAAAGALAAYGLAAELAAAQTHGPATFKIAFFDQLYNLTPEQVAKGGRIVELVTTE
jgi:hydroxyethylthiazole kinase